MRARLRRGDNELAIVQGEGEGEAKEGDGELVVTLSSEGTRGQRQAGSGATEQRRGHAKARRVTTLQYKGENKDGGGEGVRERRVHGGRVEEMCGPGFLGILD